MWSALVPGGLLAWRERRRAMHDLKGLQRLDEAVLGLDDTNAVNRAKVALEAGNQVAALGFWNEALARYPGFAKGSRDALTIMLGLRLFDDADALMREGVRRAPRDPFYAEGYAQVAERRGDNEEAILRWARVRKKCPGSWKGYVQGAICLEKAGQLDAAEALIEKALKRFPDNPSTWMQWARNAEHRHDWPEALRRWELADKRFRHNLIDISIPRVLAELGRFEEAEARLREAQTHSPIWPNLRSRGHSWPSNGVTTKRQCSVGRTQCGASRCCRLAIRKGFVFGGYESRPGCRDNPAVSNRSISRRGMATSRICLARDQATELDGGGDALGGGSRRVAGPGGWLSPRGRCIDRTRTARRSEAT